jgi:hypothetical protein
VHAQSVSLKELKLKRKYTGEKQVFIVGRIGALVLAAGGTAFGYFTSSGQGALLARARCAPPGRTAAPVLLIFSSFH